MIADGRRACRPERPLRSLSAALRETLVRRVQLSTLPSRLRTADDSLGRIARAKLPEMAGPTDRADAG